MALVEGAWRVEGCVAAALLRCRALWWLTEVQSGARLRGAKRAHSHSPYRLGILPTATRKDGRTHWPQGPSLTRVTH